MLEEKRKVHTGTNKEHNETSTHDNLSKETTSKATTAKSPGSETQSGGVDDSIWSSPELLCNRSLALRPPHLFGDFEHLINKYLGGDAAIKKSVCEADWQGRGFTSLKYYLEKLSDKSFRGDHVYTVCQVDGPNPAVSYLCELDEEIENELPELGLPSGIYRDRNMYRVDINRGGERYSSHDG